MARPPDRRHLRFFELWTRKEALIKAQGKQLFPALHGLDTSIFDDAPGNERPANHPHEGWSMSQFTPASGYVAALAASNDAFRVACNELRWSDVASDASGPSLRAIW